MSRGAAQAISPGFQAGGTRHSKIERQRHDRYDGRALCRASGAHTFVLFSHG